MAAPPVCCSVSFGVTVTRFKERSWSGEGGEWTGGEGQRRREGKELREGEKGSRKGKERREVEKGRREGK